MKLETQITKENMVGCKAKVGHQEGKIIKRDIWTGRCGKKSFLCYGCKKNVNIHKASCQRFLEFLEGRRQIIIARKLEDKIADLKQAIKLYDEAGI